jgi:ABC-2 type transport system permease protein
MSAFLAQTKAEVGMTLRRGETLLLTVGIPVLFLLFFSTVHVVSTPGQKGVNFFVPGILALAVMSTAMVSLGIATGFERGYGVLKRLGSTPLGRPRLLGAKIATILVVELVILATIAFGGIGLFLAGALKAEVNLAAANGLYLVLLLLGGMVVPIAKLPNAVRDVAKLLPADALSAALHAGLGAGAMVPTLSWVVLVVWAVAAPLAAALSFRWE